MARIKLPIEDRTPPYNVWYGKYVVTALRRIFRWSPLKKKALLAAQVGMLYRCRECGDLFNRKNVHVDHASPVVPVTGFDGWDNYISRLLDAETELHVLCKMDHKTKTLGENAERRQYKIKKLTDSGKLTTIKKNVSKQKKPSVKKKRGKKCQRLK